MAKRKTELGLGRGLNALLGDPDLQPQGEGSVTLPISQVEPGLNQPRKRFDQEVLSDYCRRAALAGRQAGRPHGGARRDYGGRRPEGHGAGTD